MGRDANPFGAMTEDEMVRYARSRGVDAHVLSDEELLAARAVVAPGEPRAPEGAPATS